MPMTVKATSPKASIRNVDKVAAELTPVGLPGGGIEERRKKDQEDQVRRQRNARDTRHERDRHSGKRQQDGVRDMDPLRNGRKDRDQEQQKQHDNLDRFEMSGH